MTANKMWGGRFDGGPARIMEEINVSVDFDKRLADHDIAGSKAHARMLAAQGIISKADADAIVSGLDQIAADIAAGRFAFKRELEDIHFNIEAAADRDRGPCRRRGCTPPARATTRWRQISGSGFATPATRASSGLVELQRALVNQADAHAATIMPGFTHLQPAQPITFGHHCLAYVEMFARDRSRFDDAATRMNESPLGAAALAGTPLPNRPRHDRERARLRASHAQFARRRRPRAISRSIIWRRPRSRPRICRASPKRSCCGCRPRSDSFR